MSQIELLFLELNESSEDINRCERLLGEAFIRKKYLMDSIPELFTAENSSTSRYYQIYIDQSMLKNRIDEQILRFCQFTNDYELMRKEFDSLAHSTSSGRAQTLIPEDQRRISTCSVEVLAAQLNRDSAEDEYSKLMSEYRESMVLISRLERTLGHDDSRRKLLEVLDRINREISAEDDGIKKLHEQVDLQKRRYRGAMMRLEEVSNSLH